jgi:hypothetical protein
MLHADILCAVGIGQQIMMKCEKSEVANARDQFQLSLRQPGPRQPKRSAETFNPCSLLVPVPTNDLCTMDWTRYPVLRV